ncbi:MAG TPA: P-loop NTPase [Nitrososphaerales archaeon]|nr:P-loop NTPase [Nitrososphaerales archaeon]
MRHKTAALGVDAERRLSVIDKVVLVGSGKGGVGKSFVSCGLALALARDSRRVALLDLDIHGASVPSYLGLRPPVSSGTDGLEPKAVGRLKVMSVGLFTGEKAVPMRGAEKQGLITQLFAMTNWGRLDYLVVDLPPSMSDELLTAFGLFAAKSALVLVTTPSPHGMEVVVRMRALAKTEGIPVLGSVVNMAYLQDGAKRSHPFGEADRRLLEESLDSPILAEIPLVQELNSGGLPEVLRRNGAARAFGQLLPKVLRWRPTPAG